MAVQKSNKSCSGVQRHPRVIFSSMCRKPLPAHNEARLRLREVGVLDERAKRGKEAMDHLCKIHHLALVADRLFHPLVFISCIVDGRLLAVHLGSVRDDIPGSRNLGSRDYD